ncbi:MAG: TylF/MycF/NovP-related O-methyltransferase [Sinimarinibacterium sp.]|jgi:hypothetical protein
MSNTSSPAAAAPAPRSPLGKLLRHLRNGTLGERVGKVFGRLPVHIRVRWYGADTPAQAAAALTRWAQIFLDGAGADGWVMSLGTGDAFHQALDHALGQRRLNIRSLSLQQAVALPVEETRTLRGIVCGHADARALTDAARVLAKQPRLSAVPFEYAAGLNPERTQFARQDEYRDTWFVAPSLLDSPNPYAIYDESLQHFEQKCGLRDYLDLYQMLRYVTENEVPGDIAEFGSYRGHSGWLIARTLQALGSGKRLYMFDMFEQFPPEPYGMDHYWNRSHFVDFAEVRGKLAAFSNVELVKGDFTQTLVSSGVGRLALAYVDCDSYRATRYLIDRLWQHHLPARGTLVCEDYGHPALLGNRAAVHEELDSRPDAFKYFSQFSGLHITLKLSS